MQRTPAAAEGLARALALWNRGQRLGARRCLEAVLSSDLELQLRPGGPELAAALREEGADGLPDADWAVLMHEQLQNSGRPIEAERWRLAMRLRGCRLPVATGAPVLRLVHHLACSGGTLISQCLAALPGVALLSEVNPFNRYAPVFAPSQPLLLLERGHRPLQEEEIGAGFRAELELVQRICQQDDVALVLRDHSHTDFCMGSEPAAQPGLRRLLAADQPQLAVLTLRHPLDCWLGLVAAGWQGQQSPATLLEYCRRVEAFLAAYPDLPRVAYEDFCLEPARWLAELAEELALPFEAAALERFGEIKLTGASGRRSERIEPRPRRPLPQEVSEELADPACRAALNHLCEAMGYPI